MKALILLVLLALTQAEFNQMQCIAGASNLFLQVKPHFVNTTGYEIAYKIFQLPEIHIKVQETLKQCGLTLPEVNYDAKVISDCSINGYSLIKQMTKEIDQISENGFTSQTLVNVIEMYENFLNAQNICSEAVYSLTINDNHLYEREEIEVNDVTCPKKIAQFLQISGNIVAEIAGVQDVMKILHNEQMWSSFQQMNSACGFDLPKITYDHESIAKCYNVSSQMKEVVIPIIADIKENGFQQNIMFQLMGLMANGEKMKESCMAAYQSLGYETPALSQEYCKNHCIKAKENCNTACKPFKFCDSECNAQFKTCNEACF